MKVRGGGGAIRIIANADAAPDKVKRLQAFATGEPSVRIISKGQRIPGV